MSSHVIISFSDLPSVVITGGTSVKTVSVGKNLTLECIANGTPQPEIQWTRVDGLLPEGLVSKGGQLIFPRARLAYGVTFHAAVTFHVYWSVKEIKANASKAKKRLKYLTVICKEGMVYWFVNRVDKPR